MTGDIPSNPESVMRVKSFLGLCRPLLLVNKLRGTAHLEGPYGVIRSRLDRIAETIRPERRGACSESRASGGTLSKTIISVAVECPPLRLAPHLACRRSSLSRAVAVRVIGTTSGNVPVSLEEG